MNNKFNLKGNTTDEDFVIHVLNILPKEYDVILDGFENCLMASGDNALTIEVIHGKLNHWYEKLEPKMKKKENKNRYWEPVISNIKKGAKSLVSMVTNLVIKSVWRTKKKTKKKTTKKKVKKKLTKHEIF